MKRSIVPDGFHAISHPAFHGFSTPFDIPREVDLLAHFAQNAAGKSHNNATSTVSVQSTAAEPRMHPCPICLDACKRPVTLIKCRHSFCEECLMRWFHTPPKPECPLCKSRDVQFLQYRYTYKSQLGLLQWKLEGSEHSFETSITLAVEDHLERFGHDNSPVHACVEQKDNLRGPGMKKVKVNVDESCQQRDPESGEEGDSMIKTRKPTKNLQHRVDLEDLCIDCDVLCDAADYARALDDAIKLAEEELERIDR